MATIASEGLHLRIYAVVSRIPRGRVATYGQIARLAGIPGQARLVGYALHALPADKSLPWQRVVNALGAISPRITARGNDGFSSGKVFASTPGAEYHLVPFSGDQRGQ